MPKSTIVSQRCGRSVSRTSSGYHASALLLRDETVEHCRERKRAAILAAGVLAAKAAGTVLEEYWTEVQERLHGDVARLEELC